MTQPAALPSSDTAPASAPAALAATAAASCTAPAPGPLLHDPAAVALVDSCEGVRDLLSGSADKLGLHGGAGCVERLMRRQLNRNLSRAQAEALWQECRAVMAERDDTGTIEEIEACDSGSLDTWPREGLQAALGEVLTGMDWPCNMDTDSVVKEFVNKLGAAFEARGYTRLLSAEQLGLQGG